MLRCTICCQCLGLGMYDLLPVSWARSRVRMLRCRICWRCLGLEAGSECKDVRFVGNVLGSKRGLNAKMYNLLRVCSARKRGSNSKMYDLLPCLGLEAKSEFQDAQVVAGVLGSKQSPNAKMCNLLPVSWAPRGVRMLRCTSCCRCLGLEAGSEC